MRTTAEPVLQGERVRLRPLEERDLTLLVFWDNDPDVRHWLHRSERPPATFDSALEWLESHREDPSWAEWLIEAADGDPIGVVRLLAIERDHLRAELGISIGDKEAWSRGYGTDAIRCVLRYAFTDLNLRRVWLITDADNARGIRCYEKCGFQREALLRGHRLRHGEPLDMLAMGVLREEFARYGPEAGG